MHSNLLNIAILSWLSATAVNALPTEEALVKRASPGIYLCENARFQGYCYHYTTPWGVCSKFIRLYSFRFTMSPVNKTLNKLLATITDRFPSGHRGVSAAGADWGNWCTLYS
jgi:hypothetical protein